MNNTEPLNENLDKSEAKVASPLLTHFWGIISLGVALDLTTVIMVLVTLGPLTFVLFPLWRRAEEISPAISPVLGVIIIIILVLSPPAIALVTGFVDRYGVESIWKISLPRNRKWLTLQGLIVLIIVGMTLIASVEFQNILESALEFLRETMPGSSGDFLIGFITTPIRLIHPFVAGLVGHLVAVKLSIFQDKSHNQVSVHSEES